MKRILFIIVLPVLLQAQETDSLRGTARLSIRSMPDGAEVMLDSAVVGVTPLADLTLKAGSYDIHIAYPSFRDWNAIVRSQTVLLLSGEEHSTSVEFGSVLNIHTTPSGAEVLHDGKNLGVTPLYHKSPVTIRSALLLKKEGYEEKVVDPVPGKLVVPLKLRGDSLLPPDVVVQSLSEKIQPRWATYTAAACVVVSGVAAAYFKRQADNRFAQYASSGGAADLDATKRYDAYSGVALVATQLSFAALTWLLLSE